MGMMAMVSNRMMWAMVLGDMDCVGREERLG